MSDERDVIGPGVPRADFEETLSWSLQPVLSLSCFWGPCWQYFCTCTERKDGGGVAEDFSLFEDPTNHKGGLRWQNEREGRKVEEGGRWRKEEGRVRLKRKRKWEQNTNCISSYAKWCRESWLEGFKPSYGSAWAPLVAQLIKNLPAM